MAIKNRIFWTAMLVLWTFATQAQVVTNAARYTQPGVDVLNYNFSLTLSD